MTTRPGKLTFFEKNDNVQTPTEFYDKLNEVYNFDFDPCPLNSDFDGLNTEWGKRNYVNPPFSKIPSFLDKGLQELSRGNLSVFLITARVSSKYWAEKVWPMASEVYFLEKLTFSGYKNKFPVPLALVVFDPSQPVPKYKRGEIGGKVCFYS